MPGQLVKFGPWPGGLNLREQPAPDLMPPTQLRLLLNMDVEDSGELSARLGARKCGSAAMYTDLSVSGTFSLLGSAETGTRRYAVVSPHNGGSPGTSTFYYTVSPNNATVGWTAVPGGSLAGKFGSLFQYGGFTYITGLPSGGATGQRRADITSGVWSSVATLPAGELSFIVRDRAFVVDKSACRVYFSKATDPTTWAAPDGGFFDVDPGSGQPITDVVVVNSQIYIFKRNRTYLFTFTADPALDGQNTLLNAQLGAYSAALWTNSIYLVNDQSVYRLLNNYFTDLGGDLNAVENIFLNVVTVPETVVNIEGNRLVVGPPVNIGVYTHFAMNLNTGAWSGRRYQNISGSTSVTGPSTRSITWRESGFAVGTDGTGNIYGHGKRLLSCTRTLNAFGDPISTLDVDDNDRVSSPEYSLVTHEYHGGDYETWKRLFWAGLRFTNGLPSGDNAVAARVAVGPLVDNPTQDVAAPAAPVSPATYGGRIAFSSLKFRSMCLTMYKTQKDMGANGVYDPNTSSVFVMREILTRMSSNGAPVSLS